MSYTTNRQPQGILMNKEAFLREGMIAEIVAINDYSKFITLTSNKEVKDIFHHIMEEEKEHYGMFLNALREIDLEQDHLRVKAKDHVKIPHRDRDKYKESSFSKESKHNLLISIRDAIKGELEAIVLYEHFIENLCDKNLIKLIKKITKDEKEHVEELTLALTLLDKDHYGPIECY
ncbi:ferritin family protein [Clostridium cylindrosporum]|uniref:Rubrerythrin family protein n=1 Tax=Clostridium cylindrosporum DSM 605 TaxID=1121307 RepID=A0A0J8G2M9_CLOCY|nr:ferritin-like domain-containing protein [Clostridium cylindrosporum]KMT21976.1 rubrerythrin family protein [Clostridium cylindrosporum DSM 605]